MTLYSSILPQYKSHFGAISTDESISFHVNLPRQMRVEYVYLVIGRDFETKYYHLNWLSTDNITEWWGLDFSFEESGTYFYHFEYDTPFGKGNIFKGENNEGVFLADGEQYQQTVYDKNTVYPQNMTGGVMYQIFPDRFYSSGKKKNAPDDRTYHTDMSDTPFYTVDKNTGKWNKDFFGGDLCGIAQKLDYLNELGVTHIYLNPIFSSHSNHRYDTADYMKIDEDLGDIDDLKYLIDEAKKRDIFIILDGVFSHTGDDSIYFNKYSRYSSIGAYQSKNSPYRSWYNFKSDKKDDYDSWWGIKSMPETNEEDESFCEFICGKGGVIDKYMSLGVKGFRLDVADELPDSFIEKVRQAVKRNDTDGIVIGEVWEDASNKISHGGRRRYFCGTELDSVMNYPFREAIIEFEKTSLAENIAKSVETIWENYPEGIIHNLMNILSTHDTERIVSILGGLSGENHDRQYQSRQKLDDNALKKATGLVKQSYTMLFTLPGVPCVYYGDEKNMQGLKDPFNRAFFPWNTEKTDTMTHIQILSSLRKSLSCLKCGQYRTVSAVMGCYCYERRDENDAILVINNKNDKKITYYLPEEWKNTKSVLFSERIDDYSVDVPSEGSVILIKKFK